jgi:hypothetical protein
LLACIRSSGSDAMGQSTQITVVSFLRSGAPTAGRMPEPFTL